MEEQVFFNKLVEALNKKFDCDAHIDNWLGGGCSAVRIPVANGIGAGDDTKSFLLGNFGFIEVWDYETDEAISQKQIDDWEAMTDGELIDEYLKLVEEVMNEHSNIF